MFLIDEDDYAGALMALAMLRSGFWFCCSSRG
jgi:hypothetical protein